jgi:lipid A 3-O-deacylase
MRKSQSFITIITACLCAALAPFANAAEPTVEQSVPDRILDTPEKRIITLVIENDSIGGGTDENYTSGVRINFTNVGAKFPDIAHKIDRLIPTFEINKTSSLYYSLGQSIFAPKDITQAAFNPDDRPWAGFLYGSLGMATLTDNHTDEVEATLGVVGPAALGEQAQKFVHKHLTDSPNPEGWSHQLKNEPGLMLAWQRAWPGIMNGRIANNYWALKPYVGATVGNIRTYGDVGFSIRLSPYESKWQDMPVRVRPAMPGTGIYEIPRNKWSWALFSGLEARAVARDIFLDGNTFADSHSVEKKDLVADATAGLALTYNNTRISYTLVYRTKEFHLQEDPQIFGALSLGVRF